VDDKFKGPWLSPGMPHGWPDPVSLEDYRRQTERDAEKRLTLALTILLCRARHRDRRAFDLALRALAPHPRDRRALKAELLFGTRSGRNARTLAPARRQVNYIATRKREHSRKPDELYPIIDACSPGPYLELFASGTRGNWMAWGDETINANATGRLTDGQRREEDASRHAAHRTGS
jgi:MT-A70